MNIFYLFCKSEGSFYDTKTLIMVFYSLGGITFLPWGDLYDLRTTWFVISPYLAAVNQAQSTRIQLFCPGSLGLCAKENSTLTFWRLHWGLGKRRGKKQSLRKHGSKARRHLEEGKFLLVHSTSRSQKCGFLQQMFYRGTLYRILGNFPTQDKFYALLFSLLYNLNIIDHCPAF